MRSRRGRCRLLPIALAIVLASVGCTDGSEPVASTKTAPVPSPSVPAATSTTVDPLYETLLPEDPAVVQGELDNGLTYYLRENDSPGGRAELRLLVDVGSVQESSDQAGMAHFLEHMMFNGTERFPHNDLIAVLEAFGPRFGPDINASTSFDETIYELSLSTEDPELVELGFDVLREWATRATLTETDVIEEREVIVDEWRLRAQGFSARVTNQVQELILPGSVYEGHDPIGTVESIRGTTSADLRRFYHDWYQPARMAIVAVGDIEVDEIKALVTELFSDIPPGEDPDPWDPSTYASPSEPRASSYEDEEATVAEVSAMWPVPSRPLRTVGDYRDSLAVSLGLDIVADRIRDDADSGEGPLLGATVIDFDWTRAISVLGLDVEVRAELAEAGMETALAEIERVRRYGITGGEFQRAIDAYSAVSRQGFEQRESVQDTQIADQIAVRHLSGGHLMSPEQRFEIDTTLLDHLDEDRVEAALFSLFAGSPAILALGPDDAGLTPPSGDRILEVLDALALAELDERDDPGTGVTSLMAAPAPAPITSRAVDPRFGFTTVEFENGATVYLWESDIAASSVYALIEGFGGTSLVDVEDLPEAFLMSEIVGRSGVADIDLPELRRLLSDRIVAIQPWITETRQGLEGDASVEDVEWLFQLIHLSMTEPRFSDTALKAVLDEMETLNTSRDDLPDLLFDEAVNEAYYGDDPRYFVVPSAEQLADFDVGAAERVYREVYDNAGDFAFVFVGDFDTDLMTDLASRYIGTLPGGEAPSGYVDRQPLPPRRVRVTTFEAGSGDQGRLGMFFTNELVSDSRDRIAARLVELIASARLRDRIREELSATYSIFAGVDLQRDPDPFAEAFIMSTGDPSGLSRISDEVLADLADLQATGPSAEEFSTAVAQLRDQLELIDNPTLANALIAAHLYPDEPVADLAGRLPILEDLSPEEITEMARIVFDLDQRIEVRQIPRP